MNLTNKKILITGGGSGIGLELAKKLSINGNDVIICGRNEDKLKIAVNENPSIRYIRCDVTDTMQVQDMMRQLQSGGGLHILINNAGIINEYDLLNETEIIPKAKAEFETNFFSVLNVTQTFLPLLKEKNEAAIINISSGLAYVPQASIPTYSATKAALHSYTLSLRYLLRKTTIKVFELLPTYTQTGLGHTAPMKKIHPSIVADACIAALQKNRYEIRVKNIKALHVMNRILPGIAFRIINK